MSETIQHRTFLSKLVEEQSRQVSNSSVLIFDADGHLTDLPFYFDHVIQNKVRQDHQRVLSHARVFVTQYAVYSGSPSLNQVRKPEGQVTQCYHNIRADSWLWGSLQDGEQQLKVLVTESG